MTTSSAIKPLVARSNDGSLIAIHLRNTSSFSQTNSNGLVRCYDGSVSSGALKFTLRFPLVRPSANWTSDEADNINLLSTESSIDGLRKLVFASDSHNDDGKNNNSATATSTPPPSYLCGMCQSSTIHIWDLERGVLSQTFDARTSAAAASSSVKKNKKKQRKSSVSTDGGREILCDIFTSGNQLFALMFFPAEEEEEGEGTGISGKCRVYQYKLDASGATLVKKIKVGSVHAAPPSSKVVSNNDTWSSSLPVVLAIAISKTTMIIRMGNVLRIYDVATGEKLCKVDIPADSILSSNNIGNYGDDSESSTTAKTTLLAPLACTPDGKFIVAGIYNQAVVFHHENQKNENDNNHTLHTMACLSTKDDSPITYLDLSLADENKLGVMTFQRAETASLFAVDVSSACASTSSTSSSSLVPQMPKAQLLTNEKDSSVSFIGAGFHPRKQHNQHSVTLQLLFQQIKKTGGSAAGSGTTLLPMESLPDALDSLEGIVIVGTSLTALDDAKAKSNKRKIAESVALAPGDQGHETLLAMDLLQGDKTKKPRVSPSSDEEGDEAEDEFPDDFDEDGEQRQSIAERLALLSSAMEETDDEEEEEEDDDDDDDNIEDGQEGHNVDSAHSRSKFKLKSATSETLTSLLTQALSSNDPTQLNIALQVTDRRLVEGTVRSLQSLDAERARQMMMMNQRENDSTAAAAASAAAQQTRYIPTLMAHIVRRMARRHSLVMPLGVWIKAILAATARSSTNTNITDQIMAKEGRDMARALGPLKNFLNERVESFAQMLKLDGRLALLNQQL